MVEVATRPAWVRWVVDAAPAVVFLIVLLGAHDFRLATWWLMGTAAVALALGYAIERKLAPLPCFVGAMALLFGGVSLFLHRSDILQMKMTIVDTALGAALFIGVAARKNPLKLLLGRALQLDDLAWARLAVRYGLFWWLCAAANEFVRRTQTVEVWAVFRIGAIVAAIAFALAQTPFLMRHGAFKETAVQPPDPPEPGY